MSTSKNDNNLLKNTFILSVVQILNLLIKILQNKIAAIALGTTGMGIVGLFTNSLHFITTGAGMGISQSAVREIAAAEAQGDKNYFNKTYTITNKIVYVTGLIGLTVTLLLSYPLSLYVFGDSGYTSGYIVLSLAVFFNIVSEGRLAILKGKRRFVDLAKCTITGSIVGFFIVVPIYWFLRESGIVWSLLLIATAQFIYVKIYVGRCKYEKLNLSLKETFDGAKQMVSMGISLMIVSFVTIVFNLIVASFIRSGGSLSNVGIYSAGATILTSYFNVLISAMSTDFYPRVSAVYEDNGQLCELVNNQCLICLSLLFPIVVIFVFAAPLFISFLYTGDFVRAAEYTDYAMIGTIFLVCSNFLGIILLAKQKSRIFLTSVFSQRTFLLFIYYFFYKYWEIKGLGFAYIVTGVSDFALMTFIMSHYFKIRLNSNALKLVITILIFTFFSMFLKTLENLYIRYVLGFILLIASLIITYSVFKNKLNIDIIQFVKQKIKK